MNFTEKIEKSNEFLKEIVSECWRDENFKNRLIQNPKITIEQLTGREYHLPEDRIITVEDQTDERFIFINIPKMPNLDNFQLTEEELENVAAGLSNWSYLAVAAAIYDFGTGVVIGVKEGLNIE